jgi:hypothetical protein
MAREELSYFDEITYGQGLEGVVNYVNSIGNNFVIPMFLMIMYGISIYVFSKSDYELGGGIFFISFVFFMMSIIAQIFTAFNQMFIFIFFIGMIVGIAMHFIK